MEELNGTMIFWLIALGMVAGAITKVSIWKQGVELVPNLVVGVIGALILGSAAVLINMPGSLAFAFMGSLAILFILNVFYLQPEGNHG